jgi:hypothetical protein
MLRFSRSLALLLTGAVLGAAVVVVNGVDTSPEWLSAPVRQERPCTPLGANAAVIVVLGQSNAGNFGAGRYVATEAVDNFDVQSGKCFAAADPLLGADGYGASFATRLGDILIQSGQFSRVVIAPMAIGGVSIAQINSSYIDKTDNLIAKLKTANLIPTHVLFEQGETDAALDTTESQYLASLHDVVRRFRSAGFQAPFFVSETTKCDEFDSKNVAAIRSAQKSAVNAELNIRRGPDTDMIGDSGRSESKCHMNEAGVLANAALWAAFIARP